MLKLRIVWDRIDWVDITDEVKSNIGQALDLVDLENLTHSLDSQKIRELSSKVRLEKACEVPREFVESN